MRPVLLPSDHDAVLVLDGEARVVEASDDACRSLGYPRAELLGLPASAFVERFEPVVYEALRARLVEHGAAFLRATHRRKDGSTYPVESRLALLRGGPPPAPVQVVVLFHDVTGEEAAREEARASEARRRQAEKMEALGTLAGGVAHDFNNILAVILGRADALAAVLAPGAAGREDAEQIGAAARRARGVVQQIVAFARRRPEVSAPVDVAQELRDQLPLVRAATPASVEVRLVAARDTGAVRADPSQVHQLLLNLGGNARDALAGRAGTIEVTVGRAEVPGPGAPAGLAPGGYVRLAVQDDGPGMDAATEARAFEPYFTTKPLGAGSGLGLAVVHGIATGLGGAVSLASAPGRGTRVEVWLPRLPDAAPAPTPAAAPARARGRILLVDDDPPVATAVARMLELAGYGVLVLGDAEAALELFKAAPAAFDLLLTDETLPGMRGDQLAKAVLALRPGLPVIIATGYSEQIDEEGAKALGARALLAKPLDLRELTDAVAAALA